MRSQKELKKILNYNEHTGDFTWITKHSKRMLGKKAGSLHHSGRINISIDWKLQSAHRVAFMYMVGFVPDYVDHINGDPADNRWCNLRAATRSQNGANRKSNKNALIKYKGVSYCKITKKYKARIIKTTNGVKKYYHLGLFDNVLDAANAVNNKGKEFFGEFWSYEAIPNNQEESI